MTDPPARPAGTRGGERIVWGGPPAWNCGLMTALGAMWLVSGHIDVAAVYLTLAASLAVSRRDVIAIAVEDGALRLSSGVLPWRRRSVDLTRVTALRTRRTLRFLGPGLPATPLRFRPGMLVTLDRATAALDRHGVAVRGVGPQDAVLRSWEPTAGAAALSTAVALGGLVVAYLVDGGPEATFLTSWAMVPGLAVAIGAMTLVAEAVARAGER